MPQFQNESSCKTFLMKMSLIRMRVNVLAEYIRFEAEEKVDTETPHDKENINKSEIHCFRGTSTTYS